MSGSTTEVRLPRRPTSVMELQTLLPSAPDPVLERSVLVEQLIDGFRRASVAVIAGSAGSGKTTLAAQLAAAWNGDVVYVCVTGRDDPESLWRLIATGAGASAETASRDDAVGAILGLDEPLIVIDDVHELDAHAQTQLADVVCDLDSVARFVVARRGADARLVHRLRGRGKVIDIGAEQLLFDRADLARLGSQAAGDDVFDLVGGWPALTLVALSAPSGSVPRIDDYLERVVLDALDAETRAAWRWASLFTRWTPEVIETVGGVRADLSQLSGRAPAVTSEVLDGTEWFGLHPCLRTLLRAELDRLETSGRIDAALECAAEWYADNGAPDEAARMYLELDRPEKAAALASQIFPLAYDDGRSVAVREWFAQMPDEVRLDVDIAAPLVFAMIDTTGPQEALEWCRRAEARGELDDTRLGHIEALRAFANRVAYHHDAALEAAARAVSLVDDAPEIEALAWVQRLEILRWRGRFEDVRSEADMLRLRMDERVPAATRVKFAAVVALATAEAGHIAEAGQLLDEARLAVKLAPNVDPAIVPGLELATALLEIQRGAVDAAQARLEALLDDAVDCGYPTTLASIRLCHARLLSSHDPGGALDRLEHCAQPGQRIEPILDSRVTALTAVAAAAAGDDELRDQSVAHFERIAGPHVGAQIQVAKLLARLGEPGRAETLLPDDVATKGAGPRFMVSAELLSHELGREVDLVGALRLADECGLSYALASHYPQALRHASLSCEVRPQFLRRVNALAEPHVDPSNATFQLTDREREILALLLTRSTLKEIGQQIHLSPNTIKTHTRSLYRKLGVATRREAAEFAEVHQLVTSVKHP